MAEYEIIRIKDQWIVCAGHIRLISFDRKWKARKIMQAAIRRAEASSSEHAKSLADNDQDHSALPSRTSSLSPGSITRREPIICNTSAHIVGRAAAPRNLALDEQQQQPRADAVAPHRPGEFCRSVIAPSI